MTKDIEYELLAMSIAHYILSEHEQHNFKTLNIQHNVLIQGKSGQSHQIDVYWEYELNDQIYKIIIECKNYSTNVSIAKVRDFFGVCYDLKDQNISGYMITKVGFQKGAKKFAEAYGISLLELRTDPTPKDLEGRVVNFNISLLIDYTKINKRSYVFDFQYLKDVLKFKVGDTISISSQTDKVFIVNAKTNQIQSVYQFEQNLIKALNQRNAFEKKDIVEETIEFEEAYLFEKNSQTKYKINSAKYEIQKTTSSEEIKIDALQSLKAILRDVKTGAITFIKK